MTITACVGLFSDVVSCFSQTLLSVFVCFRIEPANEFFDGEKDQDKDDGVIEV